MKITVPDEVMSAPEKRILSSIIEESPMLEYPVRALEMTIGPDTVEYVIPEDDKGKVLQELYPFENPPSVDHTLFCLHEQKFFRVGDFKVIREDGRNYLVSPFYATTGGMVIDWMTDEKQEFKVDSPK
jgi:hypothetical protein